MRHRGRAFGLHEDRSLITTRDAFIEWRGVNAARQRRWEIEALPMVEWRGRTLYSLRCDADFGNGPHVVNVPERVLWSLIDVRHFRCVYHR